MLMALPMAAYVFYIFLLGLLNFLTRRSYATRKKVRLSFFKTYQGEAPERVLVVGNHFNNQFQVPMLFLITCLATHIFQATSTLTVSLAWLFIGLRIVHSFIHLTSNDVLKRAFVFFLGNLVILALWVQILFSF